MASRLFTSTQQLARLASLFLLAFGLLGAPLAGAHDQNLTNQRFDSLKMNCKQLIELVQRSGEVIIYTGPHIFDRYVSEAQACSPFRSQVAYIPTRDMAQCSVGQTCSGSQDLMMAPLVIEE